MQRYSSAPYSAGSIVWWFSLMVMVPPGWFHWVQFRTKCRNLGGGLDVGRVPNAGRMQFAPTGPEHALDGSAPSNDGNRRWPHTATSIANSGPVGANCIRPALDHAPPRRRLPVRER